MDEKLIGGLLLAAITGLTFLAYKHPEAFDRLYRPLLLLFAAGTIAAGSWHVAASYTYIELLPFVRDSTAALAAVQKFQSLPWLLFLGTIAAMAYLEFLHHLPVLMEKPKPDREGNRRRAKKIE